MKSTKARDIPLPANACPAYYDRAVKAHGRIRMLASIGTGIGLLYGHPRLALKPVAWSYAASRRVVAKNSKKFEIGVDSPKCPRLYTPHQRGRRAAGDQRVRPCGKK